MRCDAIRCDAMRHGPNSNHHTNQTGFRRGTTMDDGEKRGSRNTRTTIGCCSQCQLTTTRNTVTSVFRSGPLCGAQSAAQRTGGARSTSRLGKPSLDYIVCMWPHLFLLFIFSQHSSFQRVRPGLSEVKAVLAGGEINQGTGRCVNRWTDGKSVSVGAFEFSHGVRGSEFGLRLPRQGMGMQGKGKGAPRT